jgi:hypothetical protein
MRGTGLGAFPALDFAGKETHQACAAMPGSTVKREINAIAQGSIQQQLATLGQKAFFIYRYSVASCHCAIPEGFTLLNSLFNLSR